MLRGAASPRGRGDPFRDIVRCAGEWVFECRRGARVPPGDVRYDADDVEQLAVMTLDDVIS